MRERTLIPVDALRLTALGTLERNGTTRYAKLAREVRLFATSYGVSPVDAMSSSIELLRFEGLVETESDGPAPGDARLCLTAKGQAELQRLLLAPVRPGGAHTRLMIALKVRFIGLLSPEQRAGEVDSLLEALNGELARLRALRQWMHGENRSYLAWLDRDIARVAGDIAWFRENLGTGTDDAG